jgi:hypothetical protein
MNPQVVDRPPYTIVGEARRFSRKQTAFARSAAGKSPAGGLAKEQESAAARIAEEHEGYSQMDFAVQNAAWTMASTMSHLAYSWERLAGARGLRRELAELPRCEPEDAAGFTEQIKEAARLYGADAVGVCDVDRRWLYADEDVAPERRVPADVGKAVVIAVGMDRRRIMESPTPRAAAATGNGYSRMAFTAACVAELLRNLGWRALPCGNDTALSIPLAIDAGLGEMGRHASLIHPELGSCLRLCKVFTDAPLAPDKPIELGVREQCERCTMCADQCEAKAISWGEMTAEPVCPCNNTGVLKWPVNAESCLQFWRANGTSCADCIRACPYTPRR